MNREIRGAGGRCGEPVAFVFTVVCVFLALLTATGCAPRAPLAGPQSHAARQGAVISRDDDALLEDLSKRSFMFFWEQADPSTGIVRDRSRTDGTPVDGNARDVGSMLSAENLRTGRVWSWFMRNREIPAAMSRVGLVAAAPH